MLFRFAVCVLLLIMGCSSVAAAKIPDDDFTSSGYESLYSQILEFTVGPGYDADFDHLPAAKQNLFIVAIFDSEIQNGGICQYLANWGTDSAIRVAESLRAIGLEPLAKLYEEFLNKEQIDPAKLEGFQWETVEEFIALYEKYPESMAFDNAYMQLWKDLGFESIMMEYANQNLK